jgi:23S rRNA pseudouridine1911/1915/1917 synthase
LTGDPSNDPDTEDGDAHLDASPIRVTVTEPGRLDKALAGALAAALADDPAGGAPLSRSRIAALIAAGAVRDADGALASDAAARVRAGARFAIAAPPPTPAIPEPEAIALDVIYEDAALIVIDKPAGMVVHPAPGARRGTLVAALLAHCGDSLSGVGGVARPGIVHRIDKDTSGLLVAAKTDAAHAALSAQFAAHSVERSYLALCCGAPDRGDPRLAGLPGVTWEIAEPWAGWLRVDAPLARHAADRKRMAVRVGGRRAVTRALVEARYGPADRPNAARLTCRLETGRTHQIRAHLAHVGFPLIGDPVYGRGRRAPVAFGRQALHALSLGFTHPDGRDLRFTSEPPGDLADLIAALELRGDLAG